MLRVEGLEAFYGDVQVLWGLSLSVRPGEVVAVIGPNGAGKTTLLKAIMGLVRCGRAGGGPALLYDGRPLDGKRPEDIVAGGIALVPEGARVFPEMTCRDNLLLGGYLLRDRAERQRALEEVLAMFPRLAERVRQPAKTMSGGERQMLAMGRALMGRPRFLLLDEPSLGLHPLMTSTIFQGIQRINQQGLTVLLVEQKVTFALKMSHRGYVLENGRIKMSASGQELLRDDYVKRAYLAV
ncbi:MAG: ABC transporter ATP-binding protein [Desulfarculus sp.]|nr:MAG: ABC transporter ATP-binding protein [Desulfarculus sp.]